MRRFRTSLGRFMAVIALLAIGFAVTFRPSPFWSSLFFSLALASNVLAVVAFLVTQGRIRKIALGYVICGWTYWMLAYDIYPVPIDLPRMFPEQVAIDVISLSAVWQYYQRSSNSIPHLVLVNITHAFATIASGWTGAAFAGLLTRRVASTD